MGGPDGKRILARVFPEPMPTKIPKKRACQAGGDWLPFPTILRTPCGRRAVKTRGSAPPRNDKIMAVRIRMKRVGAKNAPYFRIVVADSRSPRDGKFIEEIGTYQPRKKGENVKVDVERAKYWISKGAQPSDTVSSFLKKLSKAAAPA
jgi:small subunit ribosomal protein S16